MSGRDPERYLLLRRLFDEANQLPAEERDAYLARSTDGDDELLSELKILLTYDSEPTGGLDRPVVGALGAALDDAIESATVETNVPLPGSIGAYRIIGLLGRGGMGVVYEAEQESPARRVALKVLRPDVVTPDLLRRFEHESLVLGRLNHPGIAQIFDAGTAATELGTQPFLAMELVRGVPLTVYAERRQLAQNERLELLTSVASAVHHAHQRGVVHRDLKPANVLVDGDGHVKVLDFGVAATLDPEQHISTMHTDVGEVVGTLSYMSPEQVTGRSSEVDARSDVYALGVLAHELFTGETPFDLRGKLIHEAARIVAEDDPSTLSAYDATLRGDVEWIVGKALEKEPNRRYPSADAFAEDIRRHLADEPISARAPGLGYQAVKFARRNRAFVGGLVATLLALTVGLIVSTHLYLDSRERGLELAAALAKEQAALGEAEAVTSFIAGVLEAASPDEDENRDLTVRELLERSAPDIDQSFGDSPRVAARLHQTVARSFEDLGVYDSAIRHARRVYELRSKGEESTPGALHDAQLMLGSLLSRVGELDEADELFRLGLDEVSKPKARAAFLIQRAKNEKNRGQMAEARSMLEEALSLIESTELPEKLRFDALNQMGIVLARTGRLNEARERFEAVLAWRIEENEKDHPTILDARHNLATALSMLGRHAEVLELDKEILATRRRVLGDEHPSTLTTVHSIGEGLVQLGRFSEAETHLRKAAAGRADVLGKSHAETLVSQGALARCLDGLGRYEEAVQAYLPAIEEAESTLGASHWVTVMLVDNCGATLRSLGRFDEAIEHHQRAASSATESLGEFNAMTVTALGQLTVTLDQAGRHADAIESGEEALRLATSPQLASAVSASETRERLMQIYLRAEPVELQNPERTIELGAALPNDPGAAGPAWAILADAYARVDRFEEAITALDRGLELYADDHADVPGLKSYRDLLVQKAKESGD